MWPQDSNQTVEKEGASDRWRVSVKYDRWGREGLVRN